MRPVRNHTVLLMVGLLGLIPLRGAVPSLEERFKNPPPETRLWTFWYWVNGQVSKEGITRDLEAMHQFGIGTALMGNYFFPNLPEGEAPMFSQNWWDLTVHA